jgi:hypothetical protein
VEERSKVRQYFVILRPTPHGVRAAQTAKFCSKKTKNSFTIGIEMETDDVLAPSQVMEKAE